MKHKLFFVIFSALFVLGACNNNAEIEQQSEHAVSEENKIFLEELEEIDDEHEATLVGLWEFREVGRSQPVMIEFLADGTVDGTLHPWFNGREDRWELTDEGYFIIGSRHVEMDGDRLMVTSEWGNLRTGLREGAEPVINIAYLEYFTIDEGYKVVYSVEVPGDQFDFVIYELSEMNNELPPIVVVVVIENEAVFDVLQVSLVQMMLTRAHTQMIIEIDVDFDGRNDVLLWHWDSGSFGHPHSSFTAYLQRDGYFEENESFRSILNPYVNLENERIVGGTSGRYHRSRHHYYYIDGEFIEMASLTSRQQPANIDGSFDTIMIEERMVDGMMQTHHLCMSSDGEVCTEDDREIYERIFGENGYWRCSSGMYVGDTLIQT